MILAGDIGGTKTRLALFDVAGGRLVRGEERSFPSREYPGLKGIVGSFLDALGTRVASACFGIAGPVRDGRASTTNLPWIVDARELSRDLEIPAVSLLNDLEANAYGIAELESRDFIVLNQGLPGAQGNAAIISAGTGLGEAGLYWDGTIHRPFATEGGHADFAPGDALQAELLDRLRKAHGRVSWERVLSGPGLMNIYAFLRDTRRAEEPAWLATALGGAEDPAAVVSGCALEGRSELAGLALDLFVSIYGAEAGNLALKMLATGGVYIGGGIAPKILAKLRGGAFMHAFCNKGRMRPLLEGMAVRVIMNDRTALLGAARRATLDGGPAGASGGTGPGGAR